MPKQTTLCKVISIECLRSQVICAHLSLQLHLPSPLYNIELSGFLRFLKVRQWAEWFAFSFPAQVCVFPHLPHQGHFAVLSLQRKTHDASGPLPFFTTLHLHFTRSPRHPSKGLSIEVDSWLMHSLKRAERNAEPRSGKLFRDIAVLSRKNIVYNIPRYEWNLAQRILIVGRVPLEFSFQKYSIILRR